MNGSIVQWSACNHFYNFEVDRAVVTKLAVLVTVKLKKLLTWLLSGNKNGKLIALCLVPTGISVEVVGDLGKGARFLPLALDTAFCD